MAGAEGYTTVIIGDYKESPINGSIGGSGSGSQGRSTATCCWTTTPNNTITLIPPQEGQQMTTGCGLTVDCTMPTYSYTGLNFLLISLGIASIILAAAFAYKLYKGK